MEGGPDSGLGGQDLVDVGAPSTGVVCPCPAPGPAETRLAALCHHSRQRQELNPRVENNLLKINMLKRVPLGERCFGQRINLTLTDRQT